MGFAEDEMLDYVRRNLSDFYHINVVDILDQLAGCLTISDIEGIRARLGNQGNQRSVYDLVDALRRRSNWVNELIRALRACKHTDLADGLQSKYDALKLPTGPPSSSNSNQLSSSGSPPAQVQAQAQALPFYVNTLPRYSSIEVAWPKGPAVSFPVNTPPCYGSNQVHGPAQPFPTNTPPSYGSVPPTFAPVHLIQPPYFSPPSTSSPSTLLSQQTPERAISTPEGPNQYDSQPNRNSFTAASPPGPSSQAPTEDALMELKVAVAETQPEVGPSRTSSSNNATRLDANAALGWELKWASGSGAACPGVDAIVPSLPPRGPKKGGFESRLSENASLDRDKASGDVAPNFPSTPEPTSVGHRAGAFATDPEPTVRRKVTGLPRKLALSERSDDHMVKVTDKVSHQPSTNPNAATPAATPTSKNTFGSGVKSLIPRKAMPGSEPLNRTSPAATNENHAGAIPLPTRMFNNETGIRNSQNERLGSRSEVNRDSDEEEPPSKPGVLNSQVNPDQNSSTRPLPAVGEGSPRSSMHTSRLAISESTNATSQRIQPAAVEDPMRLHTFDRQKPELGSNDVNSGAWTVSDDSLMIRVSSSTTESMASEVNEPEEDEFFSQPSALGGRIDEARIACTHPSQATEMFDDGSSIEDMRSHHVHLTNNPTVDNYSANNAVGSSPIPSPGGANSRRNEDTKDNNIAPMHMVLPVIMFSLVGIFFLYKSRQK